jgi:TRAP-type C4-dicarboxylate transport system permease small subunit
MQLYTIFFIIFIALYVSGGFSAHHQELKTLNTAFGVSQACWMLPLPVAATC